jgi:hypothetical protein
MREFAFLLRLMGTPQQAVCSKLVTVEQLEQTLAATRDMRDPDLAKQLSELELTERLSGVRLRA